MPSFDTPAARPIALRARHVASLLCTLAITQGCTSRVSLARVAHEAQRMTYEVLRQEDCRINQLEEFCQRNFANEYVEYDRLRQRFIRESTETAWRASPTGEAR